LFSLIAGSLRSISYGSNLQSVSAIPKHQRDLVNVAIHTGQKIRLGGREERIAYLFFKGVPGICRYGFRAPFWFFS
jgi:hypothetical protein